MIFVLNKHVNLRTHTHIHVHVHVWRNFIIKSQEAFVIKMLVCLFVLSPLDVTSVPPVHMTNKYQQIKSQHNTTYSNVYCLFPSLSLFLLREIGLFCSIHLQVCGMHFNLSHTQYINSSSISSSIERKVNDVCWIWNFETKLNAWWFAVKRRM